VETTIEIWDLCKRFGGQVAVDHLSLKVPRGAVYALLGENGAGKSTTIRLLTGLLPPDSGQATVLGEDCWKHAVKLRTRVGYVPERPRFYDWMTVSEIGWFTAGFHRDGFLGRFQELLDKFELPPKAKLQTLSKGQYAKVGLALALAIDPEVLMLDEPTSGLDLVVRREFLTQMVGLAGEDKTILIASHQIAEVERVASHVAFLSHGKLLLALTMDELRQRLVRLRLRYEHHAPDPATLGRVLQRNGSGNLWQAVIFDPNRQAIAELQQTAGISDFEEAALNLEEVYMALLARKEEKV
jgi:ABC-2 type transport system ATP-binding protein